MFIDEVGNGDLRGAALDPNVRYLSLTGIMTYQSLHQERFVPAIEWLRMEFFSDWKHNPVILHRRDIVRREGPFAVLNHDQLRDAFDRAILRMIRELPYLAMTVLIDQKTHLDRYGVWRFDPYHYCLRCLVERFVKYLERWDWIGDVVIESRTKKLDKTLKASFQRIFDGGTEHLPATIVKRRLLSHDIKFFSKQADIAGLQIADLLAYPSARSMRCEAEQVPMPRDFAFQVADILISRRYARDPRTRKIDGWGRKWLP